MSDAKIRINIREGTFEIEGSESFVEKHWGEIKSFFETIPPIEGAPEKSPKKKTPKSMGKTKGSPKVSFGPIPIDLQKNGKKPSLKELFDEKKPETDMEKVTLIAYYLKKHLQIEAMEPGHALFCFNTVKKKRPLNITSTFKNAKNIKGWLSLGSKSNTYTVSIGGENHIEFELPRTHKK